MLVKTVTIRRVRKAFEEQWPFLRLQEGEQVEGELLGYVGGAIILETDAERGVLLNPHKNLVALLEDVSIGAQIRVKLIRKKSPYEYSVVVI